MGLLETRLANHSDCVEASQRPFAWAPFPARAAKPEPLEPERGPAPGHRHELTLIRRLYTRRAENRRESSRTHRKYEVPNHVVTQNDWQPPRRVENPRPKSGRSPVRSRPWPPSRSTGLRFRNLAIDRSAWVADGRVRARTVFPPSGPSMQVWVVARCCSVRCRPPIRF